MLQSWGQFAHIVCVCMYVHIWECVWMCVHVHAVCVSGYIYVSVLIVPNSNNLHSTITCMLWWWAGRGAINSQFISPGNTNIPSMPIFCHQNQLASLDWRVSGDKEGRGMVWRRGYMESTKCMELYVHVPCYQWPWPGGVSSPHWSGRWRMQTSVQWPHPVRRWGGISY